MQIIQPIKGRLGRTIKNNTDISNTLKGLNRAFTDFVHSIISTSPIG